MKHPALARVFSVLLVILGVILLVSGVLGFRKSGEEHRQRAAYEEKLGGRIANYSELHAELENAADYRQTMDALDRLLAAHEKAASRHKTDTALFSAEKGGLRMGEDMIVAMRAQMEEMRQLLHDANSRRAVLESMISELIASQKSKLPWLDAQASIAAGHAVSCYNDGAALSLTAGKLRALTDAEPASEFPGLASPIYETPAALPVPGLPQLPSLGGMSAADMQTAYAFSMDKYRNAAEAWQQAGADYAESVQDYFSGMAERELERLNHAMDRAMEEAGSARSQWEQETWEKNCREIKREINFASLAAELRSQSAAFSALVRYVNALAGPFASEIGGFFPALEELADIVEARLDRLESLRETDPADMDDGEFLTELDETQEVFELLCNAYCTVGDNLYNPASMIVELMDKLNLTDTLVTFISGMIEGMEQKMQAALENLWYQMGETEKKQLVLEAEKLGLDDEAKLLSKNTMEADELRDLQNRHTSAQQLLLSVPEVKAAVSDGGDLADSANAYLRAYERETERLRIGRRWINILAVAGGILAAAGIPAAFELVKNRTLLLAPIVLSLACSAAADAISIRLGRGQMYSALCTAIFALIQLLIVLPKKKSPVYSPMH